MQTSQKNKQVHFRVDNEQWQRFSDYLEHEIGITANAFFTQFVFACLVHWENGDDTKTVKHN